MKRNLKKLHELHSSSNDRLYEFCVNLSETDSNFYRWFYDLDLELDYNLSLPLEYCKDFELFLLEINN